MIKAKLITEVTRKCRECNEVKTLKSFTKDIRSPGGYQTLCKSCRSERRYADGSYLRERIRKHQYRHKQQTYYTDELIERILTTSNCAYCGDVLIHKKEHAKQATADHIYLGANTDNNIAICCRSCNASKGQLHVYDFYLASEKFTDDLWHEFVRQFASGFIKREPNEQEIEAWKQGFKEESEERKRYGA